MNTAHKMELFVIQDFQEMEGWNPEGMGWGAWGMGGGGRWEWKGHHILLNILINS